MKPRLLTPLIVALLGLALLGGACGSGPRSSAEVAPPEATGSPVGGAASAATTDDRPYSRADEARVAPAADPLEAAAAQASALVPAAPSCPAPPLAVSPPVRIRQTPPPAVAAAAVAVIDGESGALLWGRDEHLALQPASVTKIVTALIAVERGNLDEIIRVDLEQRLLSRGSTMGLITGDWFTLRDLLYGLMLPSGNDAAAVIATHFAGGERAFAEVMNQRLCGLGLVDSAFINPSGLGRGEFNMASAYDLAQVARAAMQYPDFREIAATRFWTARGSRTLSMRNLNELVGSFAGADGVKIGWTPGAGNTIVASATRNGHRVLVALLKTPNRAGESAALLEWAFANFAWPR